MTIQTIVDVARQAETSPHGFAYMEGKDLSGDTLLFCTKCEVSGCSTQLVLFDTLVPLVAQVHTCIIIICRGCSVLGQSFAGGDTVFVLQIVIPEYTKHCKLCQGCCRGFDHHCTWLSSCIGYKNHRLFIIFVFSLMIDNFLYVYHAFASKLLLYSYCVLADSHAILWYYNINCLIRHNVLTRTHSQ